jgi:hypothetical protein
MGHHHHQAYGILTVQQLNLIAQRFFGIVIKTNITMKKIILFLGFIVINVGLFAQWQKVNTGNTSPDNAQAGGIKLNHNDSVLFAKHVADSTAIAGKQAAISNLGDTSKYAKMADTLGLRPKLASGQDLRDSAKNIRTTLNGKQVALNGIGFIKASGTTISYDNSTYATTSNIHDSLVFFKPTNVSYSTTITFNKALTIMAGKTLASNDVLSIAANPIEGASVETALIGNGTNTFDSSTFNYQSGAFDNTNGTVNYIVMHYANGKSHIWFKTEVLIH